jgi:hypothetical protein
MKSRRTGQGIPASNSSFADKDIAVRTPVTAAPDDVAQLEEQLSDLRQEVRNLVVLGMRPDLLPDEAAFIRNLERSARAEAKLLSKALQHVKEWQK